MILGGRLPFNPRCHSRQVWLRPSGGAGTPIARAMCALTVPGAMPSADNQLIS